jgi:TRAP-type mannitol/chloroaromatic compound transport system substrate-binding protein
LDNGVKRQQSFRWAQKSQLQGVFVMDRRKFLKRTAIAGGAATAATLATPAIAQSRKEMVIVSTWPRDFPGLGTGAQRLAARIAN